MYKIIALSISFLLGLSIVQARGKSTDNEKSLLWKISGNGLTQPSYLFGTIHLICPDDYLWTSTMQEALKSCRKIAFEMDMDDPALQQEVAMGLMLKDGKTLKSFYTEEEYALLKDVLAQQGVAIDMLQALHPFALMQFIYMNAVSCPAPSSYEANIMKEAQKDSLEIVGLESAADQLNVIKNLDVDTLARQLLTVINDMDSFRNTLNDMISAYKNQDLPALNNIIINSPDYKDALDELLYDRNKKWIAVIQQLIQEQPTFIAVGAGHLLGEQGVIHLLREKGYTIDIIK